MVQEQRRGSDGSNQKAKSGPAHSRLVRRRRVVVEGAKDCFFRAEVSRQIWEEFALRAARRHLVCYALPSAHGFRAVSSRQLGLGWSKVRQPRARVNFGVVERPRREQALRVATSGQCSPWFGLHVYQLVALTPLQETYWYRKAFYSLPKSAYSDDMNYTPSANSVDTERYIQQIWAFEMRQQF